MVAKIQLVAVDYREGEQIAEISEHGVVILADTRELGTGYLHFTDGAPESPPTPELRRVMAQYWATPYKDRAGAAFGAPVAAWAFGGLTVAATAALAGAPIPFLA